jgi:iron complex outermembrane recepter protein
VSAYEIYEMSYHHQFLFKATTAIAIVTGLLAASSAYGQVAAAPTATPQLNEIIVTAQKRSERLLSVPAAVTALPAADLARQGDVRLTDYAATVPGLNLISSQPGQSVVIIRGITTGFGASIPATTATYIDDVPYGSSTANAYGSIATLDLDPATLQRVEVLRGPQGTLYGASSMGGLIKYVTTPPSLTSYSGRVELDGSSIDGGGEGWGARAMFNGPVIRDLLGVTISAFDRRDPGYIDDPHRDMKNVNYSKVGGGRLALSLQATDKFSTELSILTQNSETPSTSNVDFNTNITPIYGKYQEVRYGNETWDFRNWLYSLTANYDFGWATLTSITGYSTRTATWGIDESVKFGPIISLPAFLNIPGLGDFDHVTLDNHKTTQEIRLASPDNDKLEWLGGFFFTHEHSVKPEALQPPFYLATGLPVPQADLPSAGLFTDILHDSYTEYAGYADVTYHVTSNFKILGGLRYASNSEAATTPFSGILNGPYYVAVSNSSDRSFTYLFSPSYNFDANNIVYVRIASGYRPGGPTGLSSASYLQGAPQSYKPDRLTNYEVGYKAGLPEPRMTIELSAFDIEWQNIQVLAEVNGFNVTTNGSSARSAGAELAWTWEPIAGLSLSANAAYTDAYLAADAPGIGGKSGDKLPDVPKFTANVGADYDFVVTGDLTGFVGANYQYMGGRPIDFISSPPTGYVRPVMPSYDTVNLRVGVTRGDFTVEAYVKNVGNSYGITRLTSELSNGYGAPWTGSVIPPRTFGLSISSKF